jgi:ZIP family zinc transporter
VQRARNGRLGLLMMVVLTAHNFPEGLAVAVSALSSQRLGAVVMLAIAIHNVPEGIAIAVPIYAATGSAKRAFLMAFLSGLSEPLGAFVALVILGDNVTQSAVENLLCFVAGVMTTVAILELLPEAWHYRKPRAALLGFTVGCAIMLVTTQLMP